MQRIYDAQVHTHTRLIHVCLLLVTAAICSFRMNWVQRHIWPPGCWRSMTNRYVFTCDLPRGTAIKFICRRSFRTSQQIQRFKVFYNRDFRMWRFVRSVFLWGATTRWWAPRCSSSLTSSTRWAALPSSPECSDFPRVLVLTSCLFLLAAELLPRRLVHPARRRHDVSHLSV